MFQSFRCNVTMKWKKLRGNIMKFSHYNMDEEENKLDWMFDQAFI